jgi:serine/threonine-protein kinase
MVGASIGTPSYMAPEQVDGRAADERADVYALGLVAWEMLSGRRPWQGETLYSVLYKQKNEPLPSLAALRPDIPAFLLAAIEGALAKAPADRWRDASEFLDRLTPRPLVLESALPNALADATTMRRVVPAPTDVVLEPEPALADSTPPSDARVAADVPSRAARPSPRRTIRRAPIAVALAGAAALALLLARERADGRAADRASTQRAVAPPRDRALDSLLAAAAGRPWIDSSPRAAGADSAVRGGVSRTVGSAAGDVRLGATTGPNAPAPAAGVPAAGVPPRRVPAARVPAAPSAAPAPRESTTTAPTRETASAPPAPAPPAAAPGAPATRGATTLDERCRSATAADQRFCLLGRLEDTDAQMTRVYQEVIAGYRRAAGGEREPAAVRALRAEQRQWLVSRDRLCRARTRGSEGPLWGAARVPCFAEMATLRTNALSTRLPERASAPRRRVGTGYLLD